MFHVLIMKQYKWTLFVIKVGLQYKKGLKYNIIYNNKVNMTIILPLVITNTMFRNSGNVYRII